MIYVCDAIMGSGKTSAAITYMNEHPDRRFIYVTPIKTETTRIKDACPALHFVLPSNTIDEYEHQKRLHFKHLLSCGNNIATTHVLFSLCDQEAIRLIADQQYTVIIDEAISALDKIPAKADDVRMAMKSDWFQCENSDDGDVHEIVLSDKEYKGNWMRDIKLYAESHRLVALRDDQDEDRLYCWMFNHEMFGAAADTIVLTYLFSASPMCYLFQMNHIEYEPLNVARDATGRHSFSKTERYVPEYTKHLDEMIHVVQSKRLNQVGAARGGKDTQWSINNTKEHLKHRKDGQIETLQKNLNNFFNNIHRYEPLEEKLWSCYEPAFSALKGKGYASRYLVFNQRSTNDYKNAKYLAYCINVYMPLWEQKYYEKMGIRPDVKTYALSVMLQWIWRSAIRDGKEIWIYVPVQRMRNLLEDWMKEVQADANAAA